MDEIVSTRINLPRDMVDLLKWHSEAQGFTLAQQIRENPYPPFEHCKF